MINIPDRVLLLEVSKMFGAQGIVGACMVYYDLTDITTSPREALPRQLSKIPVYRANRLVLIEVHLRHVTERDGDALHLVFVKPELVRVPVSRAHVRELREILGL
jgi:hypothetical protein